MLTPVLGCGRGNENVNAASGQQNQSAPYGSVPAPNQQQQQARGGGMSTGQKLALLGGAAALVYMYNKNKNKKGHGPEGQYYRSKNGRIYYRDAQGNAVWVTPPAQGIQVPAYEAEAYERAARSGQWDVNPGSYGRQPALQGRY
jgi:hypothetical protein